MNKNSEYEIIIHVILTLTRNNYKVLYKDDIIVTDATREDIFNIFDNAVTLNESETAVIEYNEDLKSYDSIIIRSEK